MSNRAPRVSVGLPVYNGARYLRTTLDSILAQSFEDFELIIGDNASTDETREICESYASRDSRIRLIRHARNLGAAANYNATFTASRGEYFKWADYDDVLEPAFLERCVQVLEIRPDVAVCFPRGRFIDEQGAVIEDYDPMPDTSSAEPSVRFANLILAQDHRLLQASGLIRSDLIRKTRLHGGYPCSDEVMLAHLALLGRYYEVPERLFNIRVHRGQSTKGILASERARVLFFDTSCRDRVVLIKLFYARDCWAAIRSSPIGWWQRTKCRAHLLRWMLKPENRRPVVKDVMLAVHERIPVFGGIYRDALEAARKGAQPAGREDA